MQLTWYGTASLLLQDEDITLAFDPFCGLPETLPYKEEFRRASYVFVTHGHFDHIYHIPALYENLPVQIFCTAAPEKSLRKREIPSEKICRIFAGWEGRIGSFRITAYQSRHCRFDLPLLYRTIFCARFWKHPAQLLKLVSANLRYREKREILFYEISCRGLRIQIMGSMNLDKDTEYPVGADILILPLQGRSDQDEYALQFVKRLMPKHIFLDHCDDTFPPFSNDIDTSGFIQNVRKYLGIPCEMLPKGRPVVLLQQKENGKSAGSL